MSLPTRRGLAARLELTLRALLAGDTAPALDAPAEVKPHLDALLADGKHTVRDGILVLLAMTVEHGEVIDWRSQRLHNPAREASRELGALYTTLEIPGSREALTSVMGATRYIDRPNATWQAVLTWASLPKFDERELLQRIAEHFDTTVEDMHDPSVQSEEAQQARLAASLAHLDLPPIPGPALLVSSGAEINFVVRDLVVASQTAYSVRHIESAFLYLATGVARTARSRPKMPTLDTPKLTFSAVFALLDDLLGRRSAGAYEQFAFAALLAAWREQTRATDVVVETKRLNASDAATRSAADVQEKTRGQVTEAYEVTAEGWESKVAQAGVLLRQHNLPRIHILANGVARASGHELLGATVAAGVDITILDVREEVRSLVARLNRQYRGDALVRLYQHLVDKQPHDRLVGELVTALRDRGLVEGRRVPG
jgi:hypothetical protein